MKVQVFGLRTYEFTDEKTKELKAGVTAHYMYDDKSENVIGKGYGKFSVSKESDMFGAVMSLPLPCELRLYFNRYGKVDDLEVLEG